MELETAASGAAAVGKPSEQERTGVAVACNGQQALFDGRRGSASLFLFKKDGLGVGDGEMEEDEDAKATQEAERLANQLRADKLADEEQQRRVNEDKDREDELAIVRQINMEYSITAANEEQARRVHEYEVAKVQEQLLREKNKQVAAEAAEGERQRRISEVDGLQQADDKERLRRQSLAVEVMETERSRRLSSSEHAERVAALSLDDTAMDMPMAPASMTPPTTPPTAVVEGDSFLSEISVVQAAASKIAVDEHSEWRCFIESEDPDRERDDLRALRMSLEEDLKEYRTWPELVGDVRLLRFLRGHKHNVTVAATKFREMLAFRRTHNLDEIRKTIVEKNMAPDEFPGFQKIIPHLPFLHAYDLTDTSRGHVFYFELSGYADFRGLVNEVSDVEWDLFFFYEMEHRAIRLDQLSRQGERVVQTVFVRDLTGFSIARFHPRLLTRVVRTLRMATKCYPETTHATLLLNTPWVFHKIWRGIQPKLQETQLGKIHMGTDAYARLVALVDSEEERRDRLPTLLGGKSTVHVIPQTGFLGRNSFVLLCEDGATQAEIKARSKLQLPFRVQANDTVCWEYEVKAHDIEFAVKLRTQGDGGAQETDAVEKSRTPAGQAVAGSYTASEDCIVVLAWLNAYSWTRGKQIAYKAKVVKATHDFSCLDISGNDCV